ncbi:arginine repressor [Sediminispirochaeta smaragdinae]|uniref:Arginine repressor n=1 Tax=Sediminispirochaeta smaragdinae (strain DSM 11293 / JCM 15392 / SEBR 4228) TaxID=573413 RepID=E1R5L3_SEDSS|nr:ArgR family transcriptional regulator [Sediminispirochaeta smaragdinae]ADK82341.1 arginine repressor, ArgR [Sediminispirochaeta smaragdinae DSM 11293]
MKERSQRLRKIRELIRENRIESQEALLERLHDENYKVTQATLSRDLKFLKVGKISDGWSGYYYALPEDENSNESEKGLVQDMHRGVVSMEFSGNLGVIKTRQGHADSVAFALDKLNLPEVLGSVAGDDTIFVVLREGVTKEDLLQTFRERIPEIGT